MNGEDNVCEIDKSRLIDEDDVMNDEEKEELYDTVNANVLNSSLLSYNHSISASQQSK